MSPRDGAHARRRTPEPAAEPRRHHYSAAVAQARALVSEGRKQDAIDELKRVRRDDEGALEAQTLLARLLYEDGKLEEALWYYHKLLEMGHSDSDVYAQIGRILIEQNKNTEAREYLKKALELDNANEDALLDLTTLSISDGEKGRTEEYLRRYLEREPSNTRVALSLVRLLTSSGLIREAIRILEPHLEESGDDSKEILSLARDLYEQCGQAEAMLECEERLSYIDETDEKVIALERKEPNYKISIFSRLDCFIGDIESHLSKRHQVQRYKGTNKSEMMHALEWSDIAWFDWCDEVLVEASRLPKMCRIVARLHGHEVFSSTPERINWDNVDDLIFVARHRRDHLLERIPGLEENVRTYLVRDGIDLRRYKVPQEKGYGKSMCFVGYLNHRKGITLLLQCVRRLLDFDNEWKLYLRADPDDLRYKLAVDHMIRELRLTENVEYVPWVPDLNQWFEKMDIIVSTSIDESFSHPVAEGMAAGVFPLIFAWQEARDIFPPDCIFTTPREFVSLVRNWMTSDRKLQSAMARRFIEDNYSLERQLAEIDTLLFP
jgi:glycosyltransferase involved in cell wall biosynthesis